MAARHSLVSLKVVLLMLLLSILTLTAPALAFASGFTIPQDVALRLRMDDTLTSVDSQVGDPFNATVLTQGEYQGARVYGHIVDTANGRNTLTFLSSANL
jgi:hypothetical protein